MDPSEQPAANTARHPPPPARKSRSGSTPNGPTISGWEMQNCMHPSSNLLGVPSSSKGSNPRFRRGYRRLSEKERAERLASRPQLALKGDEPDGEATDDESWAKTSAAVWKRRMAKHAKKNFDATRRKGYKRDTFISKPKADGIQKFSRLLPPADRAPAPRSRAAQQQPPLSAQAPAQGRQGRQGPPVLDSVLGIPLLEEGDLWFGYLDPYRVWKM